MITRTAVVIAAFLGAAGAAAQGLEPWDTDASGYLDRDELAQGLAEQETFSARDTDRDGELLGDALGDLDRQRLPEWDLEGNGALDEDEFVDGAFGAGDLDADGRLDEQELSRLDEDGWFDS